MPLECANLGITEEEDPHEALRAYARVYLGAPPNPGDDVLEAAGAISTADDFRKAFRERPRRLSSLSRRRLFVSRLTFRQGPPAARMARAQVREPPSTSAVLHD